MENASTCFIIHLFSFSFSEELCKQELEDNKNDLPSMDSEASEDETSDSDDDDEWMNVEYDIKDKQV